MSTEVGQAGNVSLTQFCGRVREDGGDRRCLQLTTRENCGSSEFSDHVWMQLTREEARELAEALLEWAGK